MTSAMMFLVVPTYNEAARLNCDAFLTFADASEDAILLFVNDGSSDTTGALLGGMAASHPRVQVLTLAANCGKAEAVRQGVLAAFDAGAALVGYWDADLATPLAAVADLRRELERSPSTLLVMGSRVRLLGRTISRRAARHYFGRVFSTAASLILGLGAYDTQCGAKLFRASPDLQACFATPFRSRWIFDVELLARLTDRFPGDPADSVERIREFPLNEWRDLGDSRLAAFDFVKAPLELIGIYLNRRRDRRRSGPSRAA